MLGFISYRALGDFAKYYKKQICYLLKISFDVDNGLVLKMRNYENKKSSEIKETQELIKNVRKENITFTLDALHCQKETTKIIREGNNNYLIALKKNQRKLYNYLEKISEEKIANTINIEEDNSHGRRIKRQVSVWNNWQEIPEEISKKVKGIKTLIKVERSGTRKGKKYEQTVYYISSLLEKAEEISKKVRNHWGIENKLHWVKDVVMEEDKSQIKEKKAAQNMSVFKTIGINFFRLLKFDSITEGRRWLGANLSGFFALVE
jgi:predicted transposase YbfD/YdcC